MTDHLINTLKDLKEAVKELTSHSRLSHDCESKGPEMAPDISGLYPFHGARSFSHIFATEKDTYYFNFNMGINPKHKEKLQPIFDDKRRVIYYCNAIFDASLSHFDNLTFHQRVVDIPSIARLDYNKHGNDFADESFLSMGYLAEYYDEQSKIDKVKKYIIEHNLYSEMRCRFSGDKIPMYNLVPLDLMFIYGCGDARTTYDLGQTVIKTLNYKDQNYMPHRDDFPSMIELAKTEIELTSVLIDMKIQGMKTWPKFIDKAIEVEQNILNTLHNDLDKLTGGINVNSGKQVAEYLTSRGIKVKRNKPTSTALKRENMWAEKAKTLEGKKRDVALQKSKDYGLGNYKTDKKTLYKLYDENPKLDFLIKIIGAKEATKKISTYYGNYQILKDSDDVIHCGLNQEKAKTGRFSSTEPNLQNLHKEKWNGCEAILD